MTKTKKRNYLIVETDGNERVYEGEADIENWEKLVKDATGKFPEDNKYHLVLLTCTLDTPNLNPDIGVSFETKNFYAVKKQDEKYPHGHRYVKQRVGSWTHLGQGVISFLEQIINDVKTSAGR